MWSNILFPARPASTGRNRCRRMGPRSKIALLPKGVRQELDKRLVASSFSGYEDLELWLAGQGFQIGKSSIHRHAVTFEDKLERLKLATDQARAVVDASPDEEGAVNDALIRLVQEKAFNILLEMPDIQEVKITSLGKMIAELGRASVNQKKWMKEIKESLKSAADDVSEMVKKSGLTEETARTIREKILGVA